MTTSLGEEGAGRHGLSIFQYIYGFVTMFLCWFVLSSYDHLTRGSGSWSLWFIHFPVYLWFCNYVFCVGLCCPAMTTSVGEEGAGRYGLSIFQYIYGFVTMFLCWFVLSSYDHLTWGRGSWSLWFIHFPVYLWFCNYVLVLVLFCPAVTTSLGEEGACRYGIHFPVYLWFCNYVFVLVLFCPAVTTSLGEEGAGRYGLSIFQYIYGFVTLFLCWFVLSSYNHLTRGRGSWSLYLSIFQYIHGFVTMFFVLVCAVQLWPPH